MTLLTRHFDPLTPLTPKFPNFSVQILLFRMKHTVAIVTHAHVLQKFYTTWVQGVACQKQRLGPKLEGAWLGEHPKIWDPLHISATLKRGTSNLVHNLGLGLAYQKTTFCTKIGGGLGQGSIKKIWEPLLILAIVEASNFKFGTQIGFGTSLPKTTFGTKIGGGLGQGSSRKKFGTRYLFLQPLNLATEKLVHNMSSGLPCQTQVLRPN